MRGFQRVLGQGGPVPPSRGGGVAALLLVLAGSVALLSIRASGTTEAVASRRERR